MMKNSVYCGLASLGNQLYDFVIIDLRDHLKDSFNEYISYITEHELDLTRKEKNKLGIHFILKKLFKICSETNTRKWFFYQVENEKALEYVLVKRIFNSLPTNIIYTEDNFNNFLNKAEYSTFEYNDISKVSFRKFRQFLKRYELQALEKEYMSNLNIKLSLSS